jgi:hypothetical protein
VQSIHELGRCLDLAIEDLMRVRQTLDVTVERAYRDAMDGNHSRTFDATGAPTGSNDPVGDAVAAGRLDAVAAAYGRLVHSIGQASRYASSAYHARCQLVPLPAKEARRLAEADHAQTATCNDCGRTVAQTRDDRLRAGRCLKCFQAKRRDGENRDT